MWSQDPGAFHTDRAIAQSGALREQATMPTSRVISFDFKDRSFAFSGDTAPTEAVAKMAKGADVLVDEAMYVLAIETYIHGEITKGQPIKFEDLMVHMKADHTPVEDVGRIAQEVGVKTLVLSHLTLAIDSISDETWRTPAAKYLKGEIIVGKDLMVV